MYKLIIAILVLAMTCVSVQAESVENGSTSNSVYVVMETAAGVPTAGITVTELDLYFVEYQTAPSAKIDLAALAAGSSAYNAAGAAADCNNGLYRIDVPNTAFDGGIGTQVTIMVVDPNGTYRTAFLTVELSPSVNAVTVAGNTPITTTNIQASANAALVANNLDHLIYQACANVSMSAEVNDLSILSIMMAIDGDISTFTTATDSLEGLAFTAADASTIADQVWDEVLNEITAPLDHASTAGETMAWLRMMTSFKIITDGTTDELQFYNFAGTKILEQDITKTETSVTRSNVRLDN